ncbi:hypothetical protein IWQ57_006865, partial [Coemansia nantahalensis]
MHPPTPLGGGRGQRWAAQQLVHPREVLGVGIERLLAFHSALAPDGEARGLAYWTAAVAESFCEGGCVRLELGGQSYEMPAATAGRFYHGLFSDGGVASIHVALNDPSVSRLPGPAAIASFHSVLMTTTYATGRRVLEAGELRVIFDAAFRIRLWAFTAADTSVCLPRRRAAGPEDALPRTADATISRNLDWPDDAPAPRRR